MSQGMLWSSSLGEPRPKGPKSNTKQKFIVQLSISMETIYNVTDMNKYTQRVSIKHVVFKQQHMGVSGEF
ncbi:hypothetical protein EYF80_003567 [Liparis tanakae]|uniref:Uncharacterized protein n=1 Tax=Liparis tanakae TaxID=230148 RepID=A0A4Z2J7U3_9TELE|nr:hypothetical protein EYF80_003567 [Liparis tanakae]